MNEVKSKKNGLRTFQKDQTLCIQLPKAYCLRWNGRR